MIKYSQFEKLEQELNISVEPSVSAKKSCVDSPFRGGSVDVDLKIVNFRLKNGVRIIYLLGS